MKSKHGFLHGFITFLLVIVIFGGVGFLGYNIIFKGSMGMKMATDTSSENTDTQDSATAANSDTNQDKSEATANTTENKYIVEQVNQLTEEKQLLAKAIDTIQSSVDQMAQESYQVVDKQQSTTNNAQSIQPSATTSAESTNNNTTINIYTDQNTTKAPQQNADGQTYNADKMQSFHNGIYKASLGIQLLNQTMDNIDTQINQASVNTTGKTEYYISQYNATMQNKNMVSEAQDYMQAAIELLNVNPYVDANGLAYDNKDMGAMHESLDSYAKAVVELNQLNTNLLNQTVQLGNLAQTANNQESQTQVATTDSMNMTTGTGMNSSFLSNLNISGIFTIILVVFVVIFIVGLLGSVLQIFMTGKKEEDETEQMM